MSNSGRLGNHGESCLFLARHAQVILQNAKLRKPRATSVHGLPQGMFLGCKLPVATLELHQ